MMSDRLSIYLVCQALHIRTIPNSMLKIYVAGEPTKFGRRTMTVPELDTLLINDDSTKFWIIESKSVGAS
jgi:hypothetical protein